MKRLNRLLISSCLLFSLCVFSSAATAEENAADHFLQGRKLLEERNYTAALEAFERANALKPDLPEVLYGLGACLNALGKHGEAKEKLEAAFRLLHDRPRTVGSNWGPIDIGYYALLADIQANLNEFEAAVETINTYVIPAKGNGPAQPVETLNAVKKILSGKLVASGVKCLGSGDLECARRAFVQSEKLQPATPETLLAIARSAQAQADRTTGTTDEDKARKIELSRMAIDFSKRFPATDPSAPEAKRLLARALSGTKDAKDYHESIAILTSLWEASAGQPAPDSTILLDLTTGYLNGEEWDLAEKTASKFIQVAPESARSQGFCKRSFAYYKLGQFQNSLEDGAKCTNADGTPRQLKHVDLARQTIERRHKADEAAASAQKQSIESECAHLNQEVQWARMSQNIELSALVPIIARLENGKARCKGRLENADTSELCRSGIFTASNPANLSTAKSDDLKDLEAVTAKFLKLCDSSMDERQKAGVRDALKRISGKPATPQ